MEIVSVLVNGWPIALCQTKTEIDAAATGADILLYHREADWFEALTSTERAA